MKKILSGKYTNKNPAELLIDYRNIQNPTKIKWTDSMH